MGAELYSRGAGKGEILMIYRILEWILYRVTRRIERKFGDISDWIRETLDNWDEPSKRQIEKERKILEAERCKIEAENAFQEFTNRVEHGFPRLTIKFSKDSNVNAAMKKIQAKYPQVKLMRPAKSAHYLFYFPGWETVDMDARLNELNESW